MFWMKKNIDSFDNEKVRFQRKKTFGLFINTVLGTLLPFVLVVIVFPILGKKAEVFSPIYRGDFLLFSISVWVTVSYLAKENKKTDFDKCRNSWK